MSNKQARVERRAAERKEKKLKEQHNHKVNAAPEKAKRIRPDSRKNREQK